MKKNVGTSDRIIRLILAAIITTLFYTGTISGTVGIVLVVLAVVFFATSLVSFCPLYSILGMNTCAIREKKG
jgi:hypothetical protein